ncbi:acyl-CoA dehydratase activase [Maridesulfovibrio frigidus]|uniref:acyl-CoA dehydratase activase n=1 Tax=Maridesulfovibrio frigidus TaxID=340956 RepID=UPI0004E1A4FE|nr:acyl-CoA dehydratase activase [Maridesulfovibrio frigidus]
MITAGIDVGSVAAKAVIFDDKIIGKAVIPTGWDPKGAGEEVFRMALADAGISRTDVSHVVGTGYGRVALPFIDKKITEISCHAKGASYLFPGCRTVIDIGGQDLKVISIEEDGSVSDFIMNDKCAAGTGRFLQVMSGVLDMTILELGETALSGEAVEINSMCTVFAETEIIGLLAQGTDKKSICAGIVRSIGRRVRALSGRVSCRPEIAFTGGLALSSGICSIISDELSAPFKISDSPQLTGALGAAILSQKLAKAAAEQQSAQ